jgi:hypothetical protein
MKYVCSSPPRRASIDMRIPKEIEKKVVAKIYADAETLDWVALTPHERSNQYTKWVAEPKVGGKLQEYLSATDARVWIKDGPMKEWSRSLSGVGKYASLVEGANDTPARLIAKALGADWVLEPGSQRVKPLRVTARRDEDEIVVAWAPATGLKHLIWAALSASAEGDLREWVLCVVETFTKPTPANDKQAHQRIASRANLRLAHLLL